MAVSSAAIIDTNAVLALLNRGDPNHASARSVLPLILPTVILPEVDYLATTRLGAAASRAFQRGVIRGDFELVDNTVADYARALALQERYADLQLGLVDSSVMAIAERLKMRRVFTFDRRHFLAVEPLGLEYFEVLP
jgi:predicted nucleic acid-binding protein